jgi:Domain of unknown function DUF11
MRFPGYFRYVVPAILMAGFLACKGSDTTTSPGALANVTLNGPSSATSGQSITLDLAATAVGVNNVQNGIVTVTVPSPFVANSVNASSGTSAAISGGTVTWTLGTLDSNSQSTLHISVTGTIPPGSASQSVTFQATLTATGINAGEAVASATVQLNP